MLTKLQSQWLAAFLVLGSMASGMPGYTHAAELSSDDLPQIELNDPSNRLEAPPEPTPIEALQPYASFLLPREPAVFSTAAPPTLQGGIQVQKRIQHDVILDEAYTLPKGEKLVLTILDMVASGYSEIGDSFHARVKESVERDGKLLVPAGALVRGHIAAVGDPGASLRKRGRIELAFDYILMPDGRKIPLNSGYTKGDSALQAVGRTLGNGIGSTIGGAVRGVLLGLKLGGLQGAALSHGATLIGGGGLGAVAGMSQAFTQPGDHVLLNEGDEIKVALTEPLNLPVVLQAPDTQNEIQVAGLDVKVTDYTLGRDPFKTENIVNLTLQINNQTDYQFGSFDIALMDEYHNVYTVSPFTESDFVFQVPAHQQYNGTLAFAVKTPDVRHYVVFYKPYTRDIIAKVSLTEALKALAKQADGKRVKRDKRNS